MEILTRSTADCFSIAFAADVTQRKFCVALETSNEG